MRAAPGIALLPMLAALAVGCFNDGHNVNVQGGSNRLTLVIEPSRTDVDGTHFLLDTATGDLWRLEGRGVQGEWVRLADGPDDLSELTTSMFGPFGPEQSEDEDD